VHGINAQKCAEPRLCRKYPHTGLRRTVQQPRNNATAAEFKIFRARIYKARGVVRSDVHVTATEQMHDVRVKKSAPLQKCSVLLLEKTR